MSKRQPDLFETPTEPGDEPEAIQSGLGLAVPFSRSRALVKLDLERAEANRREPRDLTLDGRDETDV